VETIRVKARTGVLDNGVRRAPGEEFEMEASLVPAHEAAGQVRRLGSPPPRTAGPAGDGEQSGIEFGEQAATYTVQPAWKWKEG